MSDADSAVEVDFDGLVGPTHNYAGLSWGNLASQKHTNQPSNPRQAALQGLAKMKFLFDLGIHQAVLPPQERPDLSALRGLGFTGSDAQVLDAARGQPEILAACGSASAMWAANAATVSPSADTADGRVHFTPANLLSQFHRSLEAPATAAALRAIFADEAVFAHHGPLPGLADEGAANHMRLWAAPDRPGLEIFVHGRRAFGENQPGPERFPARQTREASQAIARLHGLATENVLFIRQNPRAIDAGAFHNDVVAVSNENVLLYHAAAFAEPPAFAAAVRRWFDGGPAGEVHLIEVSQDQVPLDDAIASYLFNSQLVRLPDGTMALIAPLESRDCPSTRRWLEELTSSGSPVRQVHFVDVRQSMNNGGGPACMRLRVTLSPRQIAAANPGVFFSDALAAKLQNWIERRYRDHLLPADLADAKLLDENRAALDELTGILNLGSLYEFQAQRSKMSGRSSV